MTPPNLNSNLDKINFSLENNYESVYHLQKLPQEIIVQISRELGYVHMLALATTSQTFFHMKNEFLNVSGYHQLQLRKAALIADAMKRLEIWSKQDC